MLCLQCGRLVTSTFEDAYPRRFHAQRLYVSDFVAVHQLFSVVAPALEDGTSSPPTFYSLAHFTPSASSLIDPFFSHSSGPRERDTFLLVPIVRTRKETPAHVRRYVQEHVIAMLAVIADAQALIPMLQCICISLLRHSPAGTMDKVCRL
jgi:hypothetical protein